ncbi:MAG TPA: hypothetical protein VHT71_18300 [Methylomirabilota bacterium]|jgi:hypothetical protein|nr:hypothetical protein [Methylomirabilota bacterium]
MTLFPRPGVLIVTVVVWAITVFVLEAVRIYSVLTGPPHHEEIVSNLEYQLVVSVSMVAMRWLPLLGAALLLEFLIVRLIPSPRRRARSRRSREEEY